MLLRTLLVLATMATAIPAAAQIPSLVPPAVVASLEAEYRPFDSLTNANSYYSPWQIPFAYDPISGLLATIKRGGPTESPNSLYIRVSSDNGRTWSEAIHDAGAVESGAARYPTIVVNPAKADPNSASFFYTSPILVGSPVAFGSRESGVLGRSGARLAGPIVGASIAGVDEWGTSSMSIGTHFGNGVITVGGTARNAIACSRMSFATGSVVDTIIYRSTLFQSPGGNGGYTVAPAGIARDTAGTIYLLLWGRTAAFAQGFGADVPAPLVGMSGDGGSSWSTLSGLPAETLRSFIASLGSDPDSALTMYAPVGFAVSSPGRFSIAFPIFCPTPLPAAYLVEARFNNGTWRMKKISDLTGDWAMLEDGGTEPFGNALANEVQLALTADGTQMLAKWVDRVDYVFADDIDGDGLKPDTLVSSDVMMSIRAAAGGGGGSGDWGIPVNVTTSPVLDRTTRIPTIVPNDLTQVPLLSVQSIPTPADASVRARLLDSQILLMSRHQNVTISNVDPASVSGVRAISRDRVPGVSARVLPNPSSGEGSIVIDAEAGGNGTIDLYDALGRNVATLAAGRIDAGSSRYSVGNLPDGVYFVRIRIGSAQASVRFSVVRQR